MFHALHLNPRIADIREQYPMLTADELEELASEYGSRIPRSKLPFLDAVVTIAPQLPEAGFRYHAINVKFSADLKKPAVVRRILREQQFCKRHGWTWQLVTERDVPIKAAANAKQLVNWAKYIDVPRNQAEVFADVVVHLKGRLDLGDVIRRACVLTGIEEERGTAVFAHAALHGFIALDDDHEIHMRRRLVLQATAR